MILLGPPWSALVCLDLPWSALVCLGPPSSALIHPGPLWSALVRPGPHWSALVRPGPLWSALVRTGPSRSALIRPGPPSSLCSPVRHPCWSATQGKVYFEQAVPGSIFHNDHCAKLQISGKRGRLPPQEITLFFTSKIISVYFSLKWQCHEIFGLFCLKYST